MDEKMGVTAGMLDSVGQAALTGGRLSMLTETCYDVVARNRNGKILWEEQAHNRVVTAGLNNLLDAAIKTGVTSPTWFVGLVGATITDGAITSGAAVLTSASALFLAADAGRAIIVRGAGAAGADLVTTILTFTSTSNVTLSANAGTTVTGASAIWDARAADVMSSHASWVENVNYSNANRVAFTAGTIASGSVDNSASAAVFNINTNNTLIGGLFLANNSTKSGTTGILHGMAPFSTVGFRQVNSGDTLTVTATLSITAT